MSNPKAKPNKYFNDLVFFIKEYYQLLGYRLFTYLASTIIPAFLDAIGITMIVPLLNLVLNNESSSTETSNRSAFAYQILTNLNIPISLSNVLLFILAIYLFKFLVVYLNNVYRSHLISLVVKKTRYTLYRQISEMRFQEMQLRNTGYYTNLAGVELTQYISGFAYLALFFTACFTAISYLGFSFFIDYKFSLLATLTGGVFALLFLYINKKIKRLSQQTTQNQSRITSYFIEAIQAYKYLKSTNGLRLFLDKLEGQVEQIRKQTFESERIRGFFLSISEPLIILLICFFIFVEVKILNNNVTGMLLSVFLFHRALTNIMVTQKDWQYLMNCSGSIFSVAKALQNTKNVKEQSGATNIVQPIQSIEFRNITFKYADKPAIEDVSFSIKGFNSIAFVGESGAGKTTLVDLLTLLYKPNSGSIIINGITHQELKLESYRDGIGLVSQDVQLFDDTIANNIALWSNYDEAKLTKACKQAHAYSFIQQLPDGFDTNIGDRGMRLSGGQKQRISLARELYKNPSLLILDEATSALDSESESFIKETLDELKGKMTIVMIAHRLSTIKEADKIIVLKQGRIEAHGSYADLLSTNDYFQSIVKYQQL